MDTGTWHIGPVAEVLCVVTGAVGGLLAIVVTALVYLSEDSFARLASFRWRGRSMGLHWMWWPALGGLVIGLGGLVEPRALGVGYDVIDQLLTGRSTLALIIGILMVKSLIWGLSLGSGTSGGVLAPVFMIGAALGALEAYVLPGVGVGFWALVGLAAVVGGVMRSPLTGVVFSLELTHAWPALLPLLIASSSAYALSALLLRRSVLTEKIARRGYHLSREYDVDPLEVLFVDEVMHDDPTVLGPDDALPAPPEILDTTVPRSGREQFEGQPSQDSGDAVVRQRLFPVVDAHGTLQGVVGRDQLLRAAADGPGAGRTVADLLIASPVTVERDDTLRAVRERFATRAITAAPVVTEGLDGGLRLVGLITVEHLLDGRLPDLAEEHHRSRVRTPIGRRDDKPTGHGTPGPGSDAPIWLVTDAPTADVDADRV